MFGVSTRISAIYITSTIFLFLNLNKPCKFYESYIRLLNEKVTS